MVINYAKLLHLLLSETEVGRTGIAVKRFRGVVPGIGQQAGARLGITVVRHRCRRGPVRADSAGTGGNVPGLLRRVAAIAEIIVRNAIGRRPVIRLHVRSAAANEAADPFGLGDAGAGED